MQQNNKLNKNALQCFQQQNKFNFFNSCFNINKTSITNIKFTRAKEKLKNKSYETLYQTNILS